MSTKNWCPDCHHRKYYCVFAGFGKSDMSKALKDHHLAPHLRIGERDNIFFAVSCPYGALKHDDHGTTMKCELCIKITQTARPNASKAGNRPFVKVIPMNASGFMALHMITAGSCDR